MKKRPSFRLASTTIPTLARLEAERRRHASEHPEAARGEQEHLDAVLDALLEAAAENEGAYAHARHTGEWSARIAQALAFGPDPEFLRRCGTLAELDPAELECVPEVRDCAPVVRAFQELRMSQAYAEEVRSAPLIVAVADEFDARIMGDPAAAADALRAMWQSSSGRLRPIVAALVRAVRGPREERSRRRNA